MAQTLVSLDHTEHGLFQAAWDALADGIKTEASAADANAASLVSAFLDAFDETFPEGSGPAAATRSLIRDIVRSSVELCQETMAAASAETPLAENGVAPLANNFNAFGTRLFSDAEFSEVSPSIVG